MGRKRKASNRYLPPKMHHKGRAFYLVDGTPRRWIKLGDNYRDALIEYSRRMPVVGRGHTFGELAQDWMRCHFPNLAKRTRADYTRAMGYVLKAFSDAPVSEIRPVDISRYLHLRSSKDDANREHAVLSGVLQHGVDTGWCERNVARLVRYHKREKRTRIITPAEWKKILLAALDPIPAFMDLAYITGLRIGDILKLTWGMVQDDGLHVSQSKNAVQGVYTMTEALDGVLQRCRTLHGRTGKVASLYQPDTAIIHTKKLKPYKYSGIRSAWVRACARAKVKDARIHDIRRTAITHAKQQGRRPKDFSLHKTEAMANAYVIEVPKVVPLELMK